MIDSASSVTAVPSFKILVEIVLSMLTQDERKELLAVERGDFPGDPDLGRVDTRNATILGQAWVKIRRAELKRLHGAHS